MSAWFRMPTLERAIYVATILRGIGVDACEELHSGQPYLVVEGDQPEIEAAVQRLEPRAHKDDRARGRP